MKAETTITEEIQALRQMSVPEQVYFRLRHVARLYCVARAWANWAFMM